MINLIYLSQNTTGGWVTFTAHLHKALAYHCEVNLYKIPSSNRSEKNTRPFGYGIKYKNCSIEELLTKDGINLIVATSKNYVDQTKELLMLGARIVIHDPTELRKDLSEYIQRPIIIRKNNKKYFQDSKFIPHPYERSFSAKDWPKKKAGAVSISRIDFDKNTHILLDANRVSKNLIDIYGFENRLYTRFKIVPVYPEWKQSVSAYPREVQYAAELCLKYNFMCDMSSIKGDGGGTQYTFLEAIDAGCVCVLNKKWIIKGGQMVPGINCLVVEDGEELAELLLKKSPRGIAKIRAAAETILSKHTAKNIGKRYLKELMGS